MDTRQLSKPQRDAAICRAYRTGFRPVDIGRAFGLSSRRICQILKRDGVLPRTGCIPPLLWYDDPTILEAHQDDPRQVAEDRLHYAEQMAHGWRSLSGELIKARY
jgi:hypothetical protein